MLPNGGSDRNVFGVRTTAPPFHKDRRPKLKAVEASEVRLFGGVFAWKAGYTPIDANFRCGALAHRYLAELVTNTIMAYRLERLRRKGNYGALTPGLGLLPHDCV